MPFPTLGLDVVHPFPATGVTNTALVAGVSSGALDAFGGDATIREGTLYLIGAGGNNLHMRHSAADPGPAVSTDFFFPTGATLHAITVGREQRFFRMLCGSAATISWFFVPRQ